MCLLESLPFIKRDLLDATEFDNSWKNFEIFKLSSDDRHINIGNGSIY